MGLVFVNLRIALNGLLQSEIVMSCLNILYPE